MRNYQSLDKNRYQDICLQLGIDPKLDRKATKLLNKLMNYKAIEKTIERLEQTLEGTIAFIFGAGPSLEDSINEIIDVIEKYRDRVTLIAVDGAANALYVNNLDIDIVVSDLDGCFKGIKEELFTESIVVVHGHGNNIEKIQQLSGMLRNEGLIGTTQGKETKKIRNYGGFSDGDRAVHLAANFRAAKIVMFGFDFGTVVGRFSKPEIQDNDLSAKDTKLIKFKIAKELLSKLPSQFPDSEFYNATIEGEELTEIFAINKAQIEEMFK